MAAYVFVPTGGRVSSDKELRPPLFRPAADKPAAKPSGAKARARRKAAAAGKGE